ncbi:hypothetical protein [Frigoriglobus tundricola]|uniref:hypothetical protein n=1 Tax=Frigoriglobus tundricola TaxID=2774151 RepID=UPI00148EDFAD|nr:hypothetical protein [Frigoriglobus tundricola]
MSQINFEPIAEQHAELAAAIRSIQAWIVRCVGVKFIELKRLARELPAVPSDQLALALDALVFHDQLREVFRVRDPHRDLLPENYDNPTEIPDKLLSRDDQFAFALEDGEIIHGFLLEPKRVAI